MSPVYMLPDGMRGLCRALGWFALVLIAAWIFLILWSGAPQEAADAALARLPAVHREAVTIGPLKSVLLQAISWTSVLAPLAIPFGAHRLLRTFATGRVFDAPAVRALKFLGWTVIATAVAHTLAPTLFPLALTFDSGPGHRMLTLSISTRNLDLLLIGLIIVVVGQVYGAAARIADEHGQFV